MLRRWPDRVKGIEPATDALRIADSPVGLAAWMLDHDNRGYGMDFQIDSVSGRFRG